MFELEGEMKIDPPIKYVLYEVCAYLFHFLQVPFYALVLKKFPIGPVDRRFRMTRELCAFTSKLYFVKQ